MGLCRRTGQGHSGTHASSRPSPRTHGCLTERLQRAPSGPTCHSPVFSRLPWLGTGESHSYGRQGTTQTQTVCDNEQVQWCSKLCSELTGLAWWLAGMSGGGVRGDPREPTPL